MIIQSIIRLCCLLLFIFNEEAIQFSVHTGDLNSLMRNEIVSLVTINGSFNLTFQNVSCIFTDADFAWLAAALHFIRN